MQLWKLGEGMENQWMHEIKVGQVLKELRILCCKSDQKSQFFREDDFIIPLHSLKKEYFLLGQASQAQKLYEIESTILDKKMRFEKQLLTDYDWKKEIVLFLKENEKFYTKTIFMGSPEELTVFFIDQLLEIGKKYSETLHAPAQFHSIVQENLFMFEILHLIEPTVEGLQNAIFHGIKGSRERLQSGLHRVATISISLNKSQNKRKICLSNDGIPFNKEKVIKRITRFKQSFLPYNQYFYGIDIFTILRKFPVSTVDFPTEQAGHGIGMIQIYERLAGLNVVPRFSSSGLITSLVIKLNGAPQNKIT